VVTRKINYFKRILKLLVLFAEIISLFNFTCNHCWWLHVKQNYFVIILNLFHRSISHVTM